jgi:tetratricopeptide (TPR) repeat protein
MDRAISWLFCTIVALLLVARVTSAQQSESKTTIDDTERLMFQMVEAASNYVKNRQYAEAVRTYEQALQMKPNPSDISASKARRWAQNNLAWLLANCTQEPVRDGARAVALAQQIVASYPRDVAYLDTLAAAYAEVGRFEDAIRTAQEAENNIPKHVSKDDPNVIEFRKHWDVYKSHRPRREP